MVKATGKLMSSVVKVPVWFTALSEIYESSKSNIFDNSGLFLESPTVIQLLLFRASSWQSVFWQTVVGANVVKPQTHFLLIVSPALIYLKNFPFKFWAFRKKIHFSFQFDRNRKSFGFGWKQKKHRWANSEKKSNPFLDFRSSDQHPKSKMAKSKKNPIWLWDIKTKKRYRP